MILTGNEILKQVKSKNIHITPFNKNNLTTNSYDLTLGNHYLKYTSKVLDPSRENKYKKIQIPKSGLKLQRGDFVLSYSVETIGSNKFVPIIHNKSDIARLGLFIHITADIIDIGAIVNTTFQLYATMPIILYAGMKIAQVSFWKPKGKISLYKGKYKNSVGAQASKAHLDFFNKKLHNLPEIINFKITNRCNNFCKYCYASKLHSKELSFKKIKLMIAIIKQNGAQALELTGGEPLLRKDLFQVIKEAKKQGLKIYLDTCGDDLYDKRKILKYVDTLGLPVDFPNNSYRNTTNLANILKVLKYLKNKKHKPSIRIGTVVTKHNKDMLCDIGKLLVNYNIDLWKIYEFIPINKLAINNKHELSIPMKLFNQKTKEVSKLFRSKLNILISKEQSRNKAYFFVDPSGKVYVPDHSNPQLPEKYFGNIFDKNMVSSWEKAVNIKKYEKNAHLTFAKKVINYE